MTNADYVAIAVSPALIMALVGSLVFFLIEVLYTGEYEGRLNYVFALFVFATVLIARISIEDGYERAAMFSLPLGVLTYIALLRFVEHPTPLSPVINLALLAIVWWCAHKLTWDSTVIDDNQDSSGEGLLQRIGADDPADGQPAVADNELFADAAPTGARAIPWWKRLIGAGKGPHSPGLWVLYFSLAALPLFGIGQHWIPASDAGRRRHAFALLAVYVFAGLSLLVTTSFLGLRRYLRQRNMEMPGPMAATWVSLGAVLIVVVMFLAALLPRPAAEFALSRVPWQAGSPDGLSSSSYSVGNEGADEFDPEQGVVSQDQNAPTGDAVDDRQHDETAAGDGERSGQGEASDGPPGDGQKGSGEPDDAQAGGDATSDGQRIDASPGNEQPLAGETSRQSQGAAAPDDVQSGSEPSADPEGSEAAQPDGSIAQSMLEHRQSPRLLELPQGLAFSLGGALKLALYVLVAATIAYFAWTRRYEIARALADIVRSLREFFARLFGGRGGVQADSEVGAAKVHRRTFAEFQDPFASANFRRLPPVELVRYTFEAFEAWTADRGCPRTLDVTPHELVVQAIPPQSPMYAEARRMARLYSDAAYGRAAISASSTECLRELWRMMRSAAATA